MKLFTKEIDNKLFDQYQKGSDLENQKVVAKIFNPYGRGTWYLLNSDPQDPDYIWAIVDLFEVEMGSVSRSELESIKVPPFGLGLERDLSFTPINAYELYMGLLNGKQYAEGGITKEKYNLSFNYNPSNLKNSDAEEIVSKYTKNWKHNNDFDEVSFFVMGLNKENAEELESELKMEDAYNIEIEKSMYAEGGSVYEVGGQTSLFEEGGSVAEQNKQMLKNQAKEFMHHSQELNSLVDKTNQVDAWVVAKAERASTDLSDITHYLDGRMMAKGGNVIDIKKIEKEYNSNEKYNLHSENVVLLAENFGTEEELAEAEDILKQHQEQGSLSTELYNRRSVLEDILWKKFQTMKKVVMAKGGEVWTIGEYQTIEDWNSSTKKDGTKTTTSAEGYPIRKNGVNVYVVKSKKEAIEKVKRLNSKMEDGGITAFSDNDYENKLSSFNSLKDAKKFAKINKHKYNTITFEDENGDTIVVSKDDTFKDIDWLFEFKDIDWLFEDKYADGGMMARGWTIAEEIIGGEKHYFLYNQESGKRKGMYKSKEEAIKEQKSLNAMMAKGGVTFKDKVNAISKRLEGTKVPTRLKKDYGATYDKKEAKQAGQRIAGSMIQKLKMRNKK